MNTPKKIVITGATGFLGKRLVAALSAKGYALVIFSRTPDSARKTLGSQHELVARGVAFCNVCHKCKAVF